MPARRALIISLQALFPVAYSDRFYKDVLDTVLTPEEYSKLGNSLLLPT